MGAVPANSTEVKLQAAD